MEVDLYHLSRRDATLIDPVLVACSPTGSRPSEREGSHKVLNDLLENRQDQLESQPFSVECKSHGVARHIVSGEYRKKSYVARTSSARLDRKPLSHLSWSALYQTY